MEPFKTLTSKTVVLPVENVDTDQIIPARFLKATSKAGLGSKAFADWRFDAEGKPKADFVLNRPEAASAAGLGGGGKLRLGPSPRKNPPGPGGHWGFPGRGTAVPPPLLNKYL